MKFGSFCIYSLITEAGDDLMSIQYNCFVALVAICRKKFLEERILWSVRISQILSKSILVIVEGHNYKKNFHRNKINDKKTV